MMRAPFHSVLCLAALAATVIAAAAAAQDLYIANARILDVNARAERSGNVLIVGGALTGFPATKPQGFNGREIDARGRWVMPALSDMHVHSVGNFLPPARSDGAPSPPFQYLGAEGTARVALYAGVARYLDLFSPEDDIFAARAARQASDNPAADIFAAGPCLTATNGHCSEYGVPTRIVDSPADAKREIDALAPKKPDVVKVVYDHARQLNQLPSIDRPTLEAVVKVASDHGRKTVVHVGTWDDLRDAVLAGAAAVTHTPIGTLPADIPRLMVERGTLHIPTLAVQGDYARFIEKPALLESALLTKIVGAETAALFKVPPQGETAGFIEWQRAALPTNGASVKTLAAAGVPMVTGTDAGNPGVFQGYSVHRELRLLVAAGVPVWDALAATTVNAGRLLGRDWGMKIGDEGTLVILEASPLDDIANTERIATVVLRGKVVDRDALLTPAP
jgi:imidazolonepropionase-like amidohydrolase